MNKKFTMMLAAFVAAGYTITAEAGVVKASKPGTTAKTYVIGDGTAFIGSAEESGYDKPLTVKDFDGATKWKSSIDNRLFTIVDAKEDNSRNAGVRYIRSTFIYLDGANEESYIGLEDATEGSYYLKGFYSYLVKTGEVWGKSTDKSNASPISFYEVGVPVADASGKALIINGKYVIISEGNIELVDPAAYYAMETPTVWNFADGKISNSSSYLQFDKNGNLKLGESTSAGIFETANGYLTVVTQNTTNEYSKYIQVIDGKIVAKISGEELAPNNTLSATDFVVLSAPAAIKDAYPSAVYGFPANSRLMVKISDTWKSFVMNTNQTVAAGSQTPEEGDNAYWSLNGTNLTNKNGIMVLKDSEGNIYQNFEVLTTSEASTAKSFYLKVKGEDLFVTESFTVANTGDFAVFSAIAPATDDISAIELNDINSGSFTLGYKFDDSHKATDGENPFDKEMKAFYVGSDVNTFYLATKWPAKYNSTTDCKVDDVADLQENTFTFIVATPNDHHDIREFDAFGEGSKFIEVSGGRLVAQNYQDIKSKKHPLQNAEFSMYKVKNGNYVLTMKELKYYTEDETEVSNPMTIALVAHDNKRVVTTIETGNSEVANEVSFGATIENKRTVAVKDFLKADKALIFNIKFLSKNAVNDEDWSSNEKATMSEYNKYLGINANGLFAQGSDFVNLNAPENQWIVVNADKNTNILTFQNRELSDITFKAELTKTDDANVYELKSVTSDQVNYAYVNASGVYVKVTDKSATAGEPKALTSLQGTKVLLTAVTPVAEAGYATTELDNAGLVRFSFESRTNNLTASKVFVTAEQNTDGTSGEVAVSKEESDAAQFSIVKFDAASTSTALADTLYASNDYAYWANDKVNVKSDADTIAVVTYAFKQLRADGKNYYLNADMTAVVEADDIADAARFVVKINKNGSYTLIDATGESYVRDVVGQIETTKTVNTTNSDLNKTTSIYYDYTSEREFDLNILKETPGVSYTHKPQHVTMEAVNGGYVAMNAENGEGIVAPVSTLKAEYTKEDLTFWLDTLDSEAVTPSFMISKAGKYMYNAVDSLNAYNDGTASEEKAKEFGMSVNGSNLLAKAIFQSADLTKVEDIENYKFQIVQSADEADEYIIKSLNDYKYVAAHNQKLYFTDRAVDALKLVITPAEAPTSNEGVSATEVKVVANDGSIVVKNAAGKNVVVSTILGQVVANEVLTSDNATINVPAGIVVVAVEGESFKVNVK